MAMVRSPCVSLSFSVRRSSALASRPGRFCRMTCSTWSLVQRSRVAEKLDELHRQRRLAVHERNEFAAVDDEHLAIGVGGSVRGPACPSSSAISPKISPGPIRLRMALRPSAEEMLIFTVPLITANRLVPGSPLAEDRRAPLQRGVLGVAAELVERLGIKIGRNTDACAGPTTCCSQIRELHPCCPEARWFSPGDCRLAVPRNQRGPAFQPETGFFGVLRGSHAGRHRHPLPPGKKIRPARPDRVLPACFNSGCRKDAMSARDSGKGYGARDACVPYGRRTVRYLSSPAMRPRVSAVGGRGGAAR